MVRKYASVALVCLSLAFVVLAEPEPSGQITGRTSHAGTRVTLTNRASARAITVLADTQGRYRFAGLPGGEYWLEADFEGRIARRQNVHLTATPLALDLTLIPAFQFEDIAPRGGLNFVLHNGATGRFYQPEIMLGGVAAIDYNNDGCVDIFFTNGAELPSLRKTGPEFFNRLYRNNCDRTFTDVTEKAGLSGTGYNMGVAAADYDNDGFTDLFVTGIDGNYLYRNRGDGTFENVTEKAGLTVRGRWSVSAGWFDYDNDGRLDLFVTNYVDWTPDTDIACSENGKPFYCHPRVYKGQANLLFHNNGDGTFTDVSKVSGIAAHPGKGMGVAFGDVNGDGLLDVFVSNDSVPNSLFENQGGGVFKETAVERGVGYAFHGNAVGGMGADFRDYNNDGLEDIALDAVYFETFPLYRNTGKGFADETLGSGLAVASRMLTGWGMGLFDFDNDGYKDLFTATSHFPGSEPHVHSDAAIPNHIFRNVAGTRFEDASATSGKDFQRGALNHGAAFADFDNDGRVDAVVTGVNSYARLFRNTSAQPGHWLALRLMGTQANRAGLGAQVAVTTTEGRQFNRVTTAVGYGSSSEAVVRFGLGSATVASDVEIRWPGGQLQTLHNVRADQLLEVRQPSVPAK